MPANLSDVEKRLWGAADEFRANSKLKSSEYSVPVLGLIFLRYADQKFTGAENALKGQGSGRREIGKTDYQAEGVMYLPPEARFSFLVALPEGSDIGKAVNDAMRAIEAENEDLRDVLPKTYHRLDNAMLVTLLKSFNSVPLDLEGDAFSKIYEYFLSKFALTEMVALNKSRMDFLDTFQRMIDDYNMGSSNVDEHYQMLIDFTKELTQEDSRAIQEKLSEEELAIFDLLMKPAVTLTAPEVKEVKRVAQEMLVTLKQEKMVLDWRKKPQSRAGVKLTVEKMLDRLPPVYTKELYQQKCAQVYQHLYDSYAGDGRSIYQTSV